MHDMDQPQKLRLFFFGQNFADGIRVTLSIVMPALTGALLGLFEAGITMSLGALCLSISDAPGPVKHKRNGMIYCLLFVVIMALATGFLNRSPFWMGILIAASTFFFSMFNIYGSRAASVGTGALMIMILRMSDIMPPESVLIEALLILTGGLWYLLVGMTFSSVRPNRPLQRALGDCITETAQFLKIKADLYDLTKDPEVAYRKLIAQQAVVNDKQSITRELLFKNRSILKESTFEGRLLVITFVASVDLFEQIMATWFDYDNIRSKYKDSGVLNKISDLVRRLADELTDIGEAIHSQIEYDGKLDLIEELNRIKEETEKMTEGPLDFTLRKIIIHLRQLGDRINSITRYFTARKTDLKTNLNKNDYSKFVPHQKIDGALFINNLGMESSAFRHALRVMITCTVGFVLARLFFTGHHSYWILMTIIIILKPAYSLTKEKNIDRLTGTVAGGIIGLLLLNFIKNDYALFGLLAFFALGTYTFVRLNYVVMVIFLTPYVLILFHFLGRNIVNIAGERLLDTAIASVLAWLAMHFLFPRWESHAIKGALKDVLKANIKYLDKLREIILVQKIPRVGYRLIRKEVFVSTANLSAALHRMQSEPKSKQRYRAEMYELVVLNHVLSSNIASLADSIISDPRPASRHYLNRIENCIANLEQTVRMMEPQYKYVPQHVEQPVTALAEDADTALKDQFNFIEKITKNIRRIGKKITTAQVDTQLAPIPVAG